MSINATLIAQMIVFLILVWFTMKFVWPPMAKALDERAKKIADGLSAADKAKADVLLRVRAARPTGCAEERDDRALDGAVAGRAGGPVERVLRQPGG